MWQVQGFPITTEIINQNPSIIPRLHNTYSYYFNVLYSYMSIKVQRGRKDAKVKLQQQCKILYSISSDSVSWVNGINFILKNLKKDFFSFSKNLNISWFSIKIICHHTPILKHKVGRKSILKEEKLFKIFPSPWKHTYIWYIFFSFIICDIKNHNGEIPFYK